MRKSLGMAVFALVSSGLLGASFARAEDMATPETPNDMRAVQVADGIYVFHGIAGFPTPDNEGLIANLGFIVTDAGVVLIDTGGSRNHAERLLAEVSQVTQKPVVAAFNTHIHGDHWLGNDVIKQRFEQAPIYGHPKKLESATATVGKQWIDLLDGLTEGKLEGTRALPADTSIDQGDIVTIGGTSFTAVHTGDAHTDNDIMIHIQPGNVVFLGDNAFYRRMGRMDDGSFSGNVAALDAAIALNGAVYVPGHGPATDDMTSAESYRDYLKTLYVETEKYFEEGLADFEIKDKILEVLSPWSDWPGFEEQIGRHVSLVFLEIEEQSF